MPEASDDSPVSCAARVLAINPLVPEPAAIEEAVTILRQSGMVAFPTETVYGLGARALDARAAARIYEAKGRPANNPLIVHVYGAHEIAGVVQEWSPAAERLSRHFWPGPLTLVLRRGARVPAIITAGGENVAVRVPAHPVALALLRALGEPLAAPSANPAGRLSPTCAAHVISGLGRRVDLILDGGATSAGIESTILDLTVSPPRVLRPGPIRAAALAEVLGEPVISAGIAATPHVVGAYSHAALPAPGQLLRHYSPRTPVELCDDCVPRAASLASTGRRVGCLRRARDEMTERAAAAQRSVERVLPGTPEGYAKELYAALHELDAAGLDVILIERPPADDRWAAIHDRLRRAAFPNSQNAADINDAGACDA